MSSGSGQRRSPAALADVELAALAQAGDRPAFGELVRRHSLAVRGLIRRMGAQPALADDVAQDAFLAAFERIGEFRGEGAFAGWVKRIAARLYLKRCKRQLLSASLIVDEHAEPIVTDGETQASLRLDLDEALKALSPGERLCISLCHGAGFSQVEAAEALRIPLGTVKSHIRRGLDKMKLQLASISPDAHAPSAPLSRG